MPNHLTIKIGKLGTHVAKMRAISNRHYDENKKLEYCHMKIKELILCNICAELLKDNESYVYKYFQSIVSF